MRNPIHVLKSLEEKASVSNYKYERLYRNLYNPEFYLLAYANIAKSQGSMTQGVDGQTLDNMSLPRINRIIESIRNRTYQPKPAKRKYIPKKNGKLRPLGITSTDDKLVQEVVRMILEAIYEPTFSNNSHGFRPKRSCHTALTQVKKNFTGVTWIVEGDIKACFDNFDHHVLVELLRKRISDEAFIGLIWKFLKAGYMEQWQYNCTYSGVPQGSGISPICANIYLSELDNYMQEYKDIRPPFDVERAAAYVQKISGNVQDADERKTMGAAAFRANVKRLKKLYGEIPPDRPQLRLLVNCAAASPDLAALKERTAVLTEAVNHLKTAELSMEQNYNMIDGIINNLPPDATMNGRANALIDFVEKDGQRLGDGERRLIVYYAEQVQDTGKLAALVDELAGTGYEQEHGQLNYLVKSRVEAEAAAADAQHQKDGPLPPEHDPAVQPVVTVIWSENAALHNGQKMPLAEADALFKQLDAVPREPGQYEKTSFRIDFTFNGALDSYEGRQDFGDGDGGLIDHIQSYREFYAKDEQWKDYVLRNDGPEALEKDTAQRETALTEFVPYLRLHCNLTQMERAADDVLAVVAKIEEPDGLDRTNAAYYGAVQAYVTECRGQLNTGAYQLPEAPKKEDFIDPEYQAYREQVREEVKQEAAAAGLTVEQYAANGYEPRSSSQPVQEPTGTPAMDAIEAKVQRGEAVSLMAMVDAAKSDRAAGRAGKKPSVHDTLEAAKKAPAKPRKPRTKKAPAKDGPERS